MLTHPLAVPEKRFGLSLILAFFDRCAIRASLFPPPAALGVDALIAPPFLVSKAFPLRGEGGAKRRMRGIHTALRPARFP